MKLKKPVKIVLIFILLFSIVLGLYSFNTWFFKKFNSNHYQEENKEVEKMDMIENTQTEEFTERDVSSSSSSKEKNRELRAQEIYYCSENDTLEGSECITKIEVDALEVKASDNRDYYELIFNLDTLTALYGISSSDTEEIVKEVCENELNGTMKESTTNVKEISCIFTDEPDERQVKYMCLDSSYTLQGTKCVKNAKIPAKVRFDCPEGYILDGIYCQKK